MQVRVSGKQVDVGDALRARVDEELTAGIGKYFERGGDAEVVISRDGHGFRADCAVTLASGQSLQSHGLGADAHAAFSHALSKIEKRIRRYKQRLKSHTVAATAKAAETASLYILRPGDDDESEDAWDQGNPDTPPSAMISAETESALKTLTVSGAVMELDLTESQAIVFRNAAHGGLSVVYRRADGNIGWVDPERTVAAANESRRR
jgi:ribosomal subunit interface protein